MEKTHFIPVYQTEKDYEIYSKFMINAIIFY